MIVVFLSRESDAGIYICQINTAPVISISGALAVVGKLFSKSAMKPVSKLHHIFAIFKSDFNTLF